MKKYLSFLLLPAALLLGAGQASFVATATSQFNVIINVQPSCDFQASTIPDLDFGTAASGAAVTNKTTTFTIQCTIGTAPKITLGSANSWKMIGVDTTHYDNTSADPIPYTLYSNAALTRLWRSEENTSELHSLMRTSYDVFC